MSLTDFSLGRSLAHRQKLITFDPDSLCDFDDDHHHEKTPYIQMKDIVSPITVAEVEGDTDIGIMKEIRKADMQSRALVAEASILVHSLFIGLALALTPTNQG